LKPKRRGRETLGHRLMRGTEEAQAVLRFLYHQAREGIPWWRMARRRRQGRRRLERCPRKVTSPGGPVWAESVERSGPVAKISKETTWAIKVNRAELTMGYGKFFSQFSNKIWVLKLRISNFKPKLNWGQIRINSNKLFEYFSNLQLLKISFE
jgi:hypothetical protein